MATWLSLSKRGSCPKQKVAMPIRALQMSTHTHSIVLLLIHVCKIQLLKWCTALRSGQTADEAYLNIPTDRNANRQPSMPSGMKAPMFVAYRAPAH